MNGGSNIVGLRPGHPFEGEAVGTGTADDRVDKSAVDLGRSSVAVAVVLALLGIAWLAFVVLGVTGAGSAYARELVPLIAYACAPLILLAALYLIFARGSRVETRRLALTGERLRAEQRLLAEEIDGATERLNRQAHEIVDTKDALVAVSEDAALRFQGVRDALAGDLVELRNYARTLAEATERAMQDADALTGALPHARAVVEELSQSIARVGTNAIGQVEDLDRRLDALAARGHEADAVVVEAGRRLGDELERLTGASDDAKASLSAARVGLAHDAENVLAQSRSLHQAMKHDATEQQRVLAELVGQAQAGLERVGVDAHERMRAHVAELQDRLHSLGALLESQGDTSGALLVALRERLLDLEAGFDALDRGGEERAVRMGRTIADVRRQADELTTRLDAEYQAIERLSVDAQGVRAELNESAEQLLQGLPEALRQLDHVQPVLAQLAVDSAHARQSLIETARMLDTQRAQVQGLASQSYDLFERSGNAGQQLVEVIAQADAAARALTQSAGGELVEALLRVRETANVAAERAREAIAAVIPQATEELAERTSAALSDTVTQEVERQLRQLARSAEHALAGVHDASEQLERRIEGLGAASLRLDERLDEAKTELETRDHNGFARRVALLIEALNSTAIDVGKILSTEVTDTAWQAYLRGDRGVFTRRAVRLLDANEARRIADAYEQDWGFRDGVNRYIHDFEAMLRHVLATREASTLSVTLLSSDIGKLYVALAQAVERLRI